MIHPTIPETLEFIKTAHGSQVDKGGQPYWHHPVRVMARLRHSCFSEAVRHAALLHDVVEDTDETLDSLRARGYGEDVLKLVGMLTKKEGEAYMNYAMRLVFSGVDEALAIKLADIYDNMAPSRREPIRNNIHLISRYMRLSQMIQGGIPQLARRVVPGDLVIVEQTDDEFLASMERPDAEDDAFFVDEDE